jgi:hypothetical protein
VRINNRLAVLDLSQGFQGNSKTPQYDRSLVSSGYENESMKTVLFKVSFWDVAARTGFLDGGTVAVIYILCQFILLADSETKR